MTKLTKKQRSRIKNFFLKLLGWIAVVLALYGNEVIYLARYRLHRISTYKITFLDVVKRLPSIRSPEKLLELEKFREYREHWWIALAIFFGVVIIANLFNSQFLLPVTSWKDRFFAFVNFTSFMFGRRGPLVFVKDGKTISHLGEKDRKGPGVALVYSNNAVAIGPKVHGPGVVFTWKKGKKIKTVLDLRKQIRTRGRGEEEKKEDQTKVRAVTRDGIEIMTDIEIQFSISAPPEIIYLTLNGKGLKKEDLRVLQFDNHGDVVTDIIECNFNDEELNEIFHASQKLLARDLEDIPFVDLTEFSGPSMYNHDRVQECYSNQPRGSDGEKIDWHELPIDVAIEEFRNTIVQYPFDELFLPPDYSDLVYDDFFGGASTSNIDSTRVTPIDYFQQQYRYPLAKIRREYTNTVQHSGFVAYKLMKRVGRPDVKVGDRLSELMDMSVSPIYLTSPRPLRRSQITVTAVQFGELDPINPLISEQTVKNLLTRWDTEAIKTRVGFEEKAAVIRSNAKAKVQEETVRSLQDLLLSSNQAKTAMILRIFQALEAATMGSENKELTNMIKMLGDIQKWFNLSRNDSGGKK